MAEIDPKELKGLSETEVIEKIKTDGYNEIPSSKPKSIFRIAFDVLKEPMFILLVTCGVLYLFLGDLQEAIMLLFFVFVVMGITFYQEKKTERALEALRDLSSPRALVIRDKTSKRIAGREVVPGDFVILSEGDRVPADGILIWNSNLSVDESLLTGESAAVRKTTGDAAQSMARPGGEETPFVYSGTMVVQGQAVVVIKSTGMSTELGKIGKAINAASDESTFLQKEINNLVKVVALIGAVLCSAVFIIYGYTRHDWTNGFLAGLSLAMAMLPEEFPVVMTIFFALGAWRMSHKHVLTRKVAAIETLGSATVLCVDKTGTLTQNKMLIKQVFAGGQIYDINGGVIPERAGKVIEYGILSCRKDPFDPMEKAFKNLESALPGGKSKIHESYEFVKEYPLSKKMLALSHVWKDPATGGCVIACKGAPEAVMDLCHLSENSRIQLMSVVNELASHGLRILGVAGASFGSHELPGDQHDFKYEFLGFTGLADPVRPEVAGSIKECYEAGIRVVMITGDYPGTARSIAAEIGLKNSADVITGEELEAMDPQELKHRVTGTDIFARVVPEQKLKIVQAFKDIGEVTAMTGDGVNAAPALKTSHIGIAMGGR
ncbi:MAG: HAD-IC family P-type ATPase, partial [Spirochaetia bacterium]|nr:HAD-IC family P-type ATPase [Spirochaetia bacterium]